SLAPSAGQFPTISIMFDMNKLFEKFILHCIKIASLGRNYTANGQVRKKFFEAKTIRPDIFIQHASGNFVIDTKWKAPQETGISDADLKQMYVYNNYFDCAHSILLYPQTGDMAIKTGSFHKKIQSADGDQAQYCTSIFVSLFDESGALKPNIQIGSEILETIINLDEYI
nr:hypothetical protein [Oligoflexales bacterium]